MHAFDVRDKFEATSGAAVMSGVQALVRLVLDVHRLDLARGRTTGVVVSGYEGSPLGGFDLALARERQLLSQHHVRHIPGVNEDLAATTMWGSQQVEVFREGIDGVVGLWYGKAPGLDRSSDAVRHGNAMGAAPGGGVVLAVGDDPGSKSSSLPSASEHAMADLGLAVLAPGNAHEVLHFGLHGFMLSRYSGAWAGLKIVTDVADGFSSVDVSLAPYLELPMDNVPGRAVPRDQLRTSPPESLKTDAAVHGYRLEAMQAYARANGLDRVMLDQPGSTVGVIVAGSTYYEVMQALQDMGADRGRLSDSGVRVLKVGLVHPLDPKTILGFADGLHELLVVEEKRPFMERQVREILYGRPDAPRILGKHSRDGSSLIPIDGALTASRLRSPLRAWLKESVGVQTTGPEIGTAARTPLEILPVQRSAWFCSGCPHNRSTVTPEGSVLGAGIGCHGMVQSMGDPRREGSSMTHMGGEGAQWIGQSAFGAAGHAFQNIGDGTFFHSGSLALRAAIAAGVNITYKLLYNSAVAMTGGQEPAGTRSVPEVVQLLIAEGAAEVVVVAEEPSRYSDIRLPRGVQVHGRDQLLAIQERLRQTDGVSVLIYDQECAAELRRDRKRGRRQTPSQRVLINTRVCEGCGDCGDVSNCLSVQPLDTPYGRKTQIHQGSCNFDYSCLEGDCPSFAVVEAPAAERRASSPVEVVECRTPAQPSVEEPYQILLLGIGGTGVVTANQILAAAAHIEGLRVAGLDQTGLSQKAGPVVSHLRVSAEGVASPRVSDRKADAYLAFDALVALDPVNLALVHPGRTRAVVSTSQVPTGQMVTHPDLAFPPDETVRSRFDLATQGGRDTVYLDALGLAEQHCGDPLAANMLMVGAAFQCGVLPMRAEAIEAAIRANGAAEEMNLRAFRIGRMAVDCPQTLVVKPPVTRAEAQADVVLPEAVVASIGEVDWSASSRDALIMRAADLASYQNDNLARRFIQEVNDVAEACRARGLDDDTLPLAVAHALHKLMAYKDEYEVARLYVDGSWKEQVEAEFGPGAKVGILLHPPVLRALGLKKKLRLGGWTMPFLSLLFRLRSLRGTPFDPFGYARVRRVERQLIQEYLDDVELIRGTLSAENYELATELAALPKEIRGYEEIKLAAVDRYRGRRADLRRRLEGNEVALSTGTGG